MGSLFHKAEEINGDIIGSTMLLTGLFVCFWGGKFFKQVVFFVGFVIGSLFTFYITVSIWKTFHSHIQATTRLYLSLTMGALMGILCVLVYKAAVLSVGAVGGVILAQFIFQLFDTYLTIPHVAVVQLICIVTGAILGGFLIFKLASFVLKGITAFVGSFMFTSAVSYFIERSKKHHHNNILSFLEFFTSRKNVDNFNQVCDWRCYVCLALWFTLFLTGLIVQYKLHGILHSKDLDGDDSYEDSEEEGKKMRQSKKRSSQREDIKLLPIA